MSDEVWKRIPEYEGYEVSNIGRVRSYWTNASRLVDIPHFLKPNKKHRYTMCALVYGEKGKRKARHFNIHTLVALAFLGPRPPWALVCHINGDGHDNKLENLYYATPKQNMADAKRHGTLKNGVDINTNILKPEHVIAIRDLHWSKRRNQRELAEIFGVSRQTVTAIINRVTWKDL